MPSASPPTIRFATSSDYDTLAEIASQACIDDPMDDFHHPRRRQYPHAYQNFYRQKVQYYADEPNTWIIVAVLPDEPANESENEQIAGWAHWCRETSPSSSLPKPELNSDLPQKQPLPPLRRLGHWFEGFGVADLLHDVFNPATSLSAGRQFDRTPSSEHLDPAFSSFCKPDSYWQLEKLAVAPKMQRKGVGAALCLWGMERAKSEQLMVLLEATEVGRGLYEKLGFERYGIWQWGKEKHMFEVMMQWKAKYEKETNNGSSVIT